MLTRGANKRSTIFHKVIITLLLFPDGSWGLTIALPQGTMIQITIITSQMYAALAKGSFRKYRSPFSLWLMVLLMSCSHYAWSVWTGLVFHPHYTILAFFAKAHWNTTNTTKCLKFLIEHVQAYMHGFVHAQCETMAYITSYKSIFKNPYFLFWRVFLKSPVFAGGLEVQCGQKVK